MDGTFLLHFHLHLRGDSPTLPSGYPGTPHCALLILRHAHSYRATKTGDVGHQVLEACQKGDTGEIK